MINALNIGQENEVVVMSDDHDDGMSWKGPTKVAWKNKQIPIPTESLPCIFA